MGGPLYLGKLDPKNISFNLPQTLPDLHGWTHTHTTHTLSLWLCCGRLKWPLWAELNISVHSGRASECLLPPQPWAQAASRPADQPPWTSAKLLTPPWVVPLHAALARPCSNHPPPAPLLSGSLDSRKQPRCVPNVELHWESVNVASYIFIIREDVDVLYFWGFWRSQKWKKNVCRQGYI